MKKYIIIGIVAVAPWLLLAACNKKPEAAKAPVAIEQPIEQPAAEPVAPVEAPYTVTPTDPNIVPAKPVKKPAAKKPVRKPAQERVYYKADCTPQYVLGIEGLPIPMPCP